MKLILSGQTGGSTHFAVGHPERPERVEAVMKGINDLHLEDTLEVLQASPINIGALSRVHSVPYLDELAALCRRGGGRLDADTYATSDSWNAALNAAGAGLTVLEALIQDPDAIGFVVARPPGHHALRDRAMGFCLINNIAIAARELVSRGERVLILDWDVHHGNGTQEVFWDDPEVLYVSTHQSNLFPGTGRTWEVGGPLGLGQTVNIPLPAGATGDVLRGALETIAFPVIESFQPTWTLISGGFDAHRADPLAEMALSSADFADMALDLVGAVGSGSRLMLFLEGGYDLEALRLSAQATIGALLGVAVPSELPTSGGPGKKTIDDVVESRSRAMDRIFEDANASSPS